LFIDGEPDFWEYPTIATLKQPRNLRIIPVN
jgi:hypothetical protein